MTPASTPAPFDGLLKTILKKYAMELSKIAEHPEIRAVHLRNEHERQVFTAASLDLPELKTPRL